jgi:hypothetical protein
MYCLIHVRLVAGGADYSVADAKSCCTDIYKKCVAGFFTGIMSSKFYSTKTLLKDRVEFQAEIVPLCLMISIEI